MSPLIGDVLGRMSKGSHRDDLFLGHYVKTKDKELLCPWGSFHLFNTVVLSGPAAPENL